MRIVKDVHRKTFWKWGLVPHHQVPKSFSMSMFNYFYLINKFKYFKSADGPRALRGNGALTYISCTAGEKS